MQQRSPQDSPPPRLLKFTGRHPDQTKVFTNGRRLHLVLSHYPAPPHGPDPDYTIHAHESDEQVIVVVKNITPPRPASQGRSRPKAARRHPEISVELTVDLEVPLGERPLRNNPGAEPIPVTPIATRLEPTEIPTPWSDVTDGWFHGLYGARVYGPITVLTWPITHRPRLHGLREEPHETVTIRNPNDGVAVLPSPIHCTTVGFEEMGWFYKLTGPQTPNRGELVEFARTFERPALSRQSDQDR